MCGGSLAHVTKTMREAMFPISFFVLLLDERLAFWTLCFKNVIRKSIVVICKYFEFYHENRSGGI